MTGIQSAASPHPYPVVSVSGRCGRGTMPGTTPDQIGTTMNRWPWVRRAAAAATLVIVVWRVGVGPSRDGLGAVDARALAAAAVIGLLTTACCAWRWSIFV